MKLKICLLASFILLTACGSLFDSLKEESEAVERDSQRQDAFEQSLLDRPSRGLSANSVPDYVPAAKIKFKENEDEWGPESGKKDMANDDMRPGLPKRRYNRADFIDGGQNESSLWNAQGQTNYYFAQNSRLDQGDLVIVSVDRSLKREIQYSLWKSLPIEQRRIHKRVPASGEELKDQAKKTEDAVVDAAKKAQNALADEKAAAEEAAKSSLGAEKEGDLIRMEVVENLGNGLVRLQGQKRVIYRGVPKFVEVSALARNRDIDDQSRANSKEFLDMRTRVVQ